MMTIALSVLGGERFLAERFLNFAAAALGLLEPVPVAIHFRDVYGTGAPVEQRPAVHPQVKPSH